MGKLFVFAGLLAISAGCPPPRPTLKPPKSALAARRVELPKALDAETYDHHRPVYDALPLDHPQRPALRARLHRYLLGKARRQLRRRRSEVLATFIALTTLYDPTEVYARRVRDRSLDALARRMVRAFSPRGDAQRVLPALCVRHTLAGKKRRKRLAREVWRVVRWVDSTTKAIYGRSFTHHRVLRIMEKAVRAWPAPFVLETTRKLYIERMLALARIGPLHGFRRGRATFTFPMLAKTGANIARIYLWVDRPYLALKKLREVAHSEDDQALRRLLERMVSPAANVDDFVRLAEEYEERHARVALRICKDAARRFPREGRAHACVGRLAAASRNVLLAVDAYEAALRLDANNVRYAEALAQQYQRRVFFLVNTERLGLAHRRLQQLERFLRRARKQLGKPLKASLSEVYYAVGFGLYNAGRTALAVNALRKAAAAGHSPEALFHLALVAVKQERGRLALRRLKRAEGLSMRSPRERIYWQGRIEGLRARALGLLGKQEASRAAHLRANSIWRQWLQIVRRSKPRAEALIHHATDLYALGRKADAIVALEQAIDAAPSRKETYADAIAMLTTYGHLPEALDALHRALGRPEVGEYLKTYCSLWVVGLARRAGRQPDPLLLAHLRQLSGHRWYHRLAKLVLGQVEYDQLLREAKSKAQRAELYFYQADRLLAAGRVEAARQLWKKVVKTKMMAFFEYDMALHYLRAGPVVVTEKPIDRSGKQKSTGGTESP